MFLYCFAFTFITDDLGIFFHLQSTLNRSFNAYIKLFRYYISSSWNIKGSNWILTERTTLKKPSQGFIPKSPGLRHWKLSMFLRHFSSARKILFPPPPPYYFSADQDGRIPIIRSWRTQCCWLPACLVCQRAEQFWFS